MVQKIFFLKNMISRSCIKLIEIYFDAMPNITIRNIDLGKVSLEYDIKNVNETIIVSHFNKLGFFETVNPNEILVEKIKVAAIELIYYANNTNSLIRNSDYISERVQQSYAKISKVFSSVTDTTLEKYLILLKIERTKELIIEDEYSLSEIAYMLGYSSVQYLSNQFKRITGYTVSQYKNSGNHDRISLEKLI
jgi:AraC-like DNA-binding protein